MVLNAYYKCLKNIYFYINNINAHIQYYDTHTKLNLYISQIYYTACVHRVDLFKLCTNKTIQCKHFKNHTYTFEHLTINLFYYDYSNKFIRSKPEIIQYILEVHFLWLLNGPLLYMRSAAKIRYAERAAHTDPKSYIHLGDSGLSLEQTLKTHN